MPVVRTDENRETINETIRAIVPFRGLPAESLESSAKTARSSLSALVRHPCVMAVRNPLLGLFATFGWALALTSLLSLPVLLLEALSLPREFPLFYRIAAFAAAGVLASHLARASTFGWTALPTAFLGGFLGYIAFGAILSLPVDLGFAAIHATIAGVGAWAFASVRELKDTPEVRLESEDKRRCRLCGSRVGPKARRCWSCRASLNRLT